VLIIKIQEFLDSTKGSDFHIIEVKSNPEPPYFLNFEVFISDQKINHALLPKPLFVSPSPQLNLKKTVSRTVDVELDTFPGSIVIRSTKFSGCIKDDTVIFPGNHEAFEPQQGRSLLPAVEADFSRRESRICMPIQRCALENLGSRARDLGFRKV